MQCTESLKESLYDVILIAAGAENELLLKTKEGRLKGNAMTRAGIVLLCGYFEGYIRDIVTEFADTVNDERVDINSLPEPLFLSVIESVAAIPHYQKKLPELVKLRGSIKGSQSYDLDKKKLSNTGGNPTVDTIEGIFARLGIINAVDVLSVNDFGVSSTFVSESQAEHLRVKLEQKISLHCQQHDSDLIEHLISVIESKWSPSRKRRKVGYVHAIEELLRIRNLIAHGEGREPVLPSELLAHAEKVECIAVGLDGMVSSLITNLCVQTLKT